MPLFMPHIFILIIRVIQMIHISLLICLQICLFILVVDVQITNVAIDR